MCLLARYSWVGQSHSVRGRPELRYRRARWDVSERLIRVNGMQLWVAEHGAGDPLILCNGGPGCCDYLGPVAAMLDDRARVYRFEPRGCGRSATGVPYDLPTWLADLDALRSALGHERWVVGGHSAGADYALAYALTYPGRVRALISLASTGVQDDRQWHAAYEAGRVARPPLCRLLCSAAVKFWRSLRECARISERMAEGASAGRSDPGSLNAFTSLRGWVRAPALGRCVGPAGSAGCSGIRVLAYRP